MAETGASLANLELKFDAQGLIPAIVQDRLTGEVRMLAWMNREALDQTLRTRKATFYSRSRAALWVKGETSGHFLEVTAVAADCDGDTLLVSVDPAGPSCHTGQDNCFFGELDSSGAPNESTPTRPFLLKLEQVLIERAKATSEKSYTRSLLDGGAPKIGAKLREEADELARAIADETDERVSSEAADLLFHLMVALRSRGVPLRQVEEVLAGRFGTSGHLEKARRGSDAK
jgi:phosphoribosyl-AMP cyclohydrolase / phosphoribosyl-ATP pyrophosphohydrolase